MITVIHNVYTDNPFIRESVTLNLKALTQAGIEYQYIVFNDNGATNIVYQLQNLNIEYIYSPINYGNKMCSGGWVGAIPYIKGSLIHNTGQDDVFTSFFYKSIVLAMEDPSVDLVYCNGFKVREDLTLTGELLGPIAELDYTIPRAVFNSWFGINNNIITRANNNIPAPGTVYRTALHNEIGIPGVEEFRGVSDFEYWSRVLFFKKQVRYIPLPNWLYRMSSYTTSTVEIDGKSNERDLSPIYIDKMKVKYQELLNNE